MPLKRSSSFPQLKEPAQSLERSKSIGNINSGHSKSSTISTAQAALHFARMSQRNGCSNQRAGYSGSLRPWIPKVPTVSIKLMSELRSQYDAKKGLSDKRVDYIMKAQFGNCGEKSQLVCDYLSRAGLLVFQDFNIVFLWPDDHHFVVLNQNADEKGKFPDSFSDWDENAVVIDAWAGICVAARHYPETWSMMLDTMDAVDYELLGVFYVDDCGERKEVRKWMRANADYWKQMPWINRKFQLYKAPPLHELYRVWNESTGKPEINKFIRVRRI